MDEFDVGPISDSDAGGNAVNENAANGTVVGLTALASDADATNNTILYTLDDNAGGRFAIDGGTGVVTVADGTLLDREAAASHNMTVRATSSDGSFNTQLMTINLLDVDEFDVGPVSDIDAVTNEVAENSAIGTVVGITAAASDADATTNAITYTLQDNDGGRFSIDSGTGIVRVAGAIDREADGPTRNITVRATSADGSFTDQVFAININDVDEFDVGPVTDSDGTANAVDENAVIGTVVGIDVTAGDGDATNNTIIYSLVDGDGGRFAINSSTGVVTVDGAMDRETDGASRNITVRATSSDASFTDQVFAIAINPLNDNNPVISSDGGGASASINVLENDLYVSTVAASDGDLPAETLTYSIVGGIDAANFAIDGSTGVLTFVSAPDFESPTDAGANNVYDVVVQVSDGTFADTQSIAVTVNDVADSGQYLDLFNSASYNNSDGTEAWTNSWVESEANGPSAGNIKVSVGELRVAAKTLNDFVYREADLGSAVGASLSFTYNNLMTGSDSIHVQVSGNGGSSYTTLHTFNSVTDAGTGSKSFDISSYTATDTRIRFLVATIDGNAKDLKIDNVQVDYAPNTAPVINSNGAGDTANVSVSENSTAVTTVTTSDPDLPGQTLTYSIIGGVDAAKFSIDSGSGALTFVAAANHESPTDSGMDNVYDVTVQVSDGIDTDTQAIAVTVIDVDEFDVTVVSDVDATANAVDENAANGTIVGVTASASDADSTNNTISYSLDDNAGGRFTIDGTTGVVTVADGSLLDRESAASHDITVRASSSDGSFSTAVMTINLNDVDEFDVGVVSDSDVASNSVNENAAGGTVVGITTLASDADATNNTILYSLDDNAGGRFTIDSNTGVVTVADGTLLDREAAASHNITVRATSSDGSFNTQLLTINLLDVDEFDVGPVSDIDAVTNEVAENSTIGTVVGITASASDLDATTSAITYSLQDNDGGRFSIDSGTGIVRVAGGIDREADGPTRNITVRATSADGSFTDQVFAININDVDEFNVGPVTDSDGTANAVDENATVGTVVGIDVAANDVDATNNTITYSLVDNDGGRFTIDSGTGVVTVAAAINREADGASRNITVRATSSDSSFTDQVFAINVNDVNEFSVGAMSDSNGAANAVDENASMGTAVGITAFASDADATNNNVLYTLDDDAGGRFTIDGSTGVVTVAGASTANLRPAMTSLSGPPAPIRAFRRSCLRLQSMA